MYQIRWHGRGGQGAVTAARALGLAASVYGNGYAQSFPAFGAERRGAPVLAFTKVDTVPILDRSQIYEPDLVVVLDKSLLKVIDVTLGLKIGGKIVINANKEAEELLEKTIRDNYEIVVVNASQIAQEVMGSPITNTAMAGAVCAASGLVGFDSLAKAITDLFPPNQSEKNKHAASEAYNAVINYIKGGGKLD